MSATLEVPEEIANEVRELVETGAYPNSESAVREAFRLLREHLLRQQLDAKLENAFAQGDQGEFVEFNDETRERIIREGHAKYERGDSLNPDVVP